MTAAHHDFKRLAAVSLTHMWKETYPCEKRPTKEEYLVAAHCDLTRLARLLTCQKRPTYVKRDLQKRPTKEEYLAAAAHWDLKRPAAVSLTPDDTGKAFSFASWARRPSSSATLLPPALMICSLWIYHWWFMDSSLIVEVQFIGSSCIHLLFIFYSSFILHLWFIYDITYCSFMI